MEKRYTEADVAIVGSGPAGMSAALELIKLKAGLKIIMFEMGPVRTEADRASADKLTCGWGGAGAFSDGKLNLSLESGGHLLELVGEEYLRILMRDVVEQYDYFGGDKGDFVVPDKRANSLKKKVLSAGFKNLIYYQTRHWGSDNAFRIAENIRKFLEGKGVEIKTSCPVDDIGDTPGVSGYFLTDRSGKSYLFRHVIFAGGRESNEFISNLAKNNFKLPVYSNGVDIGLRVETIAEAFEMFTDVMQSPKLVIESGGNEVRTFCVCPYGFVRLQDSYGNLTVNGESFSEESGKRSANTNFAILVHVDFTTPFDDPTGYGNMIASLTNTLGGKKVIVQTLYDLLKGRRSTVERIEKRSIVRSTLKIPQQAEPANLGRAIPYDILSGVLKMLDLLMKITPMNESNVLLYGPEIKQYAQRMGGKRQGLYIVGDGSGWTRGIMQASMMGILAARSIAGQTT